MRARSLKALAVGRHILGPVRTLVDVGDTEFPVLLWLVESVEKSSSLLLVR